MNTGWIKINRGLLDWEWFDEPEMVHAWLYILLTANTEEKKWKGITVQRGQLVITVAGLAARLGISVKKMRIILDRLISTGELGKETANKYTILTICKYDVYQANETPEGQTNGEQRANKGQTKGIDLRIKEYKKESITKVIDEKEKNTPLSPDELAIAASAVTDEDLDRWHRDSGAEKEVPPDPPKKKAKPKVLYAECVRLTLEEYAKLVNQHGEDLTNKFIGKLNSYKLAHGKKYASDYGAILNWVVPQVIKDENEASKSKPRSNGQHNNNSTGNAEPQEAVERDYESSMF